MGPANPDVHGHVQFDGHLLCLPGSRGRRPDYPTPAYLLKLTQGSENVLMWLPMASEAGSGGSGISPAATLRQTLKECGRQGLEVLAVRWRADGSLPGCLLVYRVDSAKVAQRKAAVVENVVRTMGQDWRMV